MRKIREVLRLYYDQDQSARSISITCKMCRETVAEYLRRSKAADLKWPLDHLNDEELENLLYPPRKKIQASQRDPDWAYIHKELKRKAVTKQLLWLEYKQNCPEGYQYSQFCLLYRQWAKNLDPVMRIEHKAGDKMFVDWAGMTIPILNATTGEETQAQLFVATLGASSYCFVKAYPSQKLPNWITGHVDSLEYFGGIPKACVPDNPKTGITKPDYYDPEINPTYADFAGYYQLAIVPARVRKPQDKAIVETSVLIAERWILAKLRNQTFFSIQELNQHIAFLLEELNNKPFQKLEGSRKSLFVELDQPELRPLPTNRYQFANWKKAKVSKDYHIECQKHYYSVPYIYLGESVDVRYTEGTVEIFCKNKRIASHFRSYKRGRYSTINEHRPKNHQQYADWPPERILGWANKIGSNVHLLVETHMQQCQYPEQAYRRAFGIIGLAKDYSNERVDAACQRALAINSLKVASIKSILKSGLDQQPLPEETQKTLPIEHPNVRGADYYH